MTRFVWVSKTDPVPDGFEDRWNDDLGLAYGIRPVCGAKLLVECMSVAVSVCEGSNTVPNPHELDRAISETMGEQGREVRARAKEMVQKARAATEARGSSTIDLERLVKELSSL
ncbi:hypothetical protein N665_0402s0034 [Sinapis alba]|nr:hypothetical protein N665_0402s0034 [Sinapis alba]